MIVELIDHYLAPLATKNSLYFKDTTDFINNTEHLNIYPNSLFITLDIESMHINIENKNGLKTAHAILKNN